VGFERMSRFDDARVTWDPGKGRCCLLSSVGEQEHGFFSCSWDHKTVVKYAICVLNSLAVSSTLVHVLVRVLVPHDITVSPSRKLSALLSVCKSCHEYFHRN
jgi:hypothetical protein